MAPRLPCEVQLAAVLLLLMLCYCYAGCGGGGVHAEPYTYQTALDRIGAATSGVILDDHLIIDGATVRNLTALLPLSEIEGSIEIRNTEFLDDITGLQNVHTCCTWGTARIVVADNARLMTLEGLGGITHTEGSIYVNNNAELRNLTGFEQLTAVATDGNYGVMAIYGNPKLQHVDALLNVEYAANLAIRDSIGLTSIRMPSLTTVGGGSPGDEVRLENLPLITTLAGAFPNLTVSDGLDIDNMALVDLDGFEALTTVVHNVVIDDNAAMTMVSGLRRLQTVGGHFEVADNNELLTLSGAAETGMRLQTVGGDLMLIGNDKLMDVTALANLTDVGGRLSFHNNDDLVSLAGLEGLRSIGGTTRDYDGSRYSHYLELSDNEQLANISALAGLAHVPGAYIQANAVESLHGLHNVASINGSLRLITNQLLTDASMPALRNVSDFLEVSGCQALTTLAGFSALESLGGCLKIADNDYLTSIGMDSLTHIGETDGDSLIVTEMWQLATLDFAGFTNVSLPGALRLTANDALADVDSLSALWRIGGDIEVVDNPQLTSLAALDGVCGEVGSITIVGNDNLLTIDGLSGVTACDRFKLGSLPELTSASFSALADVWGEFVVEFTGLLSMMDGFPALARLNGNVSILHNSELRTVRLDGVSSIGLDSEPSQFVMRNNSVLTAMSFRAPSLVVNGDFTVEKNRWLCCNESWTDSGVLEVTGTLTVTCPCLGDERCYVDPCGEHGADCSQSGFDVLCVCQDGWSGEFCQDAPTTTTGGSTTTGGAAGTTTGSGGGSTTDGSTGGGGGDSSSTGGTSSSGSLLLYVAAGGGGLAALACCCLAMLVARRKSSTTEAGDSSKRRSGMVADDAPGGTELVGLVDDEPYDEHVSLQDTYGAASARNHGDDSRGSLYFEFTQASSAQAALSERVTPSNLSWVIKMEDVQLQQQVGKGSYGIVYKAQWRHQDVAVKLVKFDDETAEKVEELLRDFEHESELMCSMRPHDNVVGLRGVIVDPVAVVTEYLGGGSLDAFLRSSAELTVRAMLNIAVDIAKGMHHLHSEKIIHRDLAARNVLLDSLLKAKISDFGYSRLVAEDSGRTNATVGPLKWMAPESIIDSSYSTKSDVWSFGVVLTELFGRDDPYPGQSSAMVCGNVVHMNATPPCPDAMPPMIVDVVSLCCSREPADRPAFTAIVDALQNVLSDTVE